mmetsp:Transcript_25065/g.80135  ORF Transcript_25065/g.80135 Transcript_25065/m.80135 type:complete len:221 (-) Transcript_25065:85-747(-)
MRWSCSTVTTAATPRSAGCGAVHASASAAMAAQTYCTALRARARPDRTISSRCGLRMPSSATSTRSTRRSARAMRATASRSQSCRTKTRPTLKSAWGGCTRGAVTPPWARCPRRSSSSARSAPLATGSTTSLPPSTCCTATARRASSACCCSPRRRRRACCPQAAPSSGPTPPSRDRPAACCPWVGLASAAPAGCAGTSPARRCASAGSCPAAIAWRRKR